MTRTERTHACASGVWVSLLVVYASCDGESVPDSPRVGARITVKPELFGIPPELADFGILPSSAREFKAWRGFTGDGSVSALERSLDFSFPPAFVSDCREHNGGVLTGILFFNTKERRGFSTSHFLGFGNPDPNVSPFNDDIISEYLSNNTAIFTREFSGFVPFAIVQGPMGESQELAAYCLGFSKKDSSVHLLHLQSGESSPVADSYSSFLENAVYVAVD